MARTTRQIPTGPVSEKDVSLYLFYGDEFLVKEQVQKLIEQKLDPKLRGTNFITVDGSVLDVGELYSLAATPSLFGAARVILVENTTVFSARSDQRKIAARALESWKRGDRKTALKSLAQLLNLAGLGPDDIRQGVDWAGDVLGQSPGAEDRDTLVQVGQAFLEEGSKAGSRGDDGQLEELVTSSFPDGTILIFTAADIDKRKKIFKTLESRAQVILCAAREDKQRAGLDRSFFEERVEKFLKPAGKRIRAEALDEMYARAGKNLRQLHSEIAKLVGYVGQREEIIREDVERVFMDFHEVAFFELNRVLRTGDRGQCLTALQENLKIVSHPLQTLATIANEFRKIMVARELLFTIFRQSWKPGISFNNFKPILGQVREAHPDLMKTGKFKLLAMNDYALYFLLNDAQRFPMYKLIRIMECVLEADLMMKSTRVGSRSPELILEDLVLSICHPTTLSPQ